LEDYAQTWDDPEHFPDRRWDETYIRWGWRCGAPGCTSRRNLEDHHIVYRSGQGGNEPENQVCLCRFHHQLGEHGRLARFRGRAALGLHCRLGTPGMAAWYQNEMRLRV